jgi:hypothetical protein
MYWLKVVRLWPLVLVLILERALGSRNKETRDYSSLLVLIEILRLLNRSSQPQVLFH